MRLFCFPYAGGRALNYRSWSNHLPANVEVCAIELPGRGTLLKETPFTRIKPLVETIAQNILPKLDRPFALFGHSMGALVSFELAHFLRNKYSLNPVHLFVSAHRAPQIISKKPPIYSLPDPEFLAQLHRLNGTSQEILQNRELMELFLPILRADFEVLETYTHQALPPLECPITAFGGLSDSEANIDELEAWAKQTKSTFLLKMFQGDHFFIHSAQSQLLEYLNQFLLASCTNTLAANSSTEVE
ncbi:putative thioesterase involved in non-ribosomal peptide biosynthesis [Rivularia sp. PCC 7116]|uniref:thioesterase II family protein n=1 Tax=Rivularia sp. PCC 7116 TaxID=373994 RepID=UPI00029F365A|nr:thioesterase II family protein [Rivularia sp. PCC 7116]AFY58517.1 putative thioesterase involved in non-ribosomal peptide biosynthesis [Rivularia sp. PCC 7116]